MYGDSLNQCILKHRMSILFFCVLLTVICFATPSRVYANDTIVHVTKTGECYHTGACPYLKSDIPITLEEAHQRGFRNCSKCNPPLYVENTGFNMAQLGGNASNAKFPGQEAAIPVSIAVLGIGGGAMGVSSLVKKRRKVNTSSEEQE